MIVRRRQTDTQRQLVLGSGMVGRVAAMAADRFSVRWFAVRDEVLACGLLFGTFEVEDESRFSGRRQVVDQPVP